MDSKNYIIIKYLSRKFINVSGADTNSLKNNYSDNCKSVNIDTFEYTLKDNIELQIKSTVPKTNADSIEKYNKKIYK